jgi:hypothetical protein
MPICLDICQKLLKVSEKYNKYCKFETNIILEFRIIHFRWLPKVEEYTNFAIIKRTIYQTDKHVSRTSN